MIFDYMRKTGINAHQLALKVDVHPSLVYRFTQRGARACSATSAYKLVLVMDIEPQEFCTALEYYELAPLGMLPSTSTEDIQEATT